MSEHETPHEHDQVMEFDLPLAIKSKLSHDLSQRHASLYQALGCAGEDEALRDVFDTVASLCDPFTQPEETPEYILSLDCISDLVIALVYSNYVRQNQAEIQDDHVELGSIKFEISLRLFALLRQIHKALNADDELTSRYVNNDTEHWKQNLHQWTPRPPLNTDSFDLKLVYSIACVLILSIYKLFGPRDAEQYNVIMNPYLHHFLKLWKCHTNIILLGLEIDRRIEFDNHEKGETVETPEIVKRTLKGSSSIRYVLSWIINQNPSSFYEEDQEEIKEFENHDLKDESLFNFIQPILRKKINGGSLSVDMRLVIIGLLILNTGISFSSGKFSPIEAPSKNEDEASRRLNRSKPLTELGDILIDLEYDDRFDEDIRYIFEYEYDGWESESEQEEDEEPDGSEEGEEGEEPIPQLVAGETSTSSEKVKDIPDVKPEQPSSTKGLTPIRSIGEFAIEYDEFGRDWRDIPRKENAEYSPWFLQKLDEFDGLKDKEDSNDFFTSWNELYETFEFLSTTSIQEDFESEKKVGQVLINTIAKAIKDEFKEKSAPKKTKKSKQSQQEPTDEGQITPDKIVQYWFSSASEESVRITQENNKLIVPILNITKFEIFLHNNYKLVRCLMDEMLMCKGYRRVLIWFLTHNVNLSTLLIDYVYELLAGFRGDPKRQKPYLFTREGGKVILSEIEQSMLLHEFLTNSSIYLSSTEGIDIEDGYKVVLAESIAMKYMSLMCLMINGLINIGIINLDRQKIRNEPDEEDDIHDYRNELQVLLINWVGKLPEARKLFFKVKNSNNPDEETGEIHEEQEANGTEAPDSRQDLVRALANTKSLKALDSASLTQQEDLFKKYSTMSIGEIAEDMDSNGENMEIVYNFAKRLEVYLKLALSPKTTSIEDFASADLASIHGLFRFFFENFNTLCKIEYIADTLFAKFQSVISGELVADTPLDGKKGTELAEPEFNNEFLNGQSEGTPSDASKKKKNKKKNKKKKK